LSRVKKRLKIFGVIIDYKQIDNQNIFIKEEDFNKIQANVKYYVSLKIIEIF
jgi:hypothetical protein